MNTPKAPGWLTGGFFAGFASAVAAVVVACSNSGISAAEFANNLEQDAAAVVDACQRVEATTNSTTLGTGNTLLANVDTVLSRSQSTFEAVGQRLLKSPKPRGVESSATEMWSATNELGEAMKSARAYFDSNKPSDLSAFRVHWDTGRAWWNQGVVAIWEAASKITKPMITGAPTAPPPT